jgi:putative phosphoribosyl transferase
MRQLYRRVTEEVADEPRRGRHPRCFAAARIGAFADGGRRLAPDDCIEMEARQRTASGLSPSVERREVAIPVGDVTIAGSLAVPADAVGVVVFAHGSGSSRFSPRNRYVAEVLQGAGLATLLIDLLTADEELDRRNVFDVGLLAGRLAAAASRLDVEPALCHLPVGYFGASTGAAAALSAAADNHEVAAVVSRGGRPDLASPRLGEVRAPTLLIVGGRDEVVLELNRAALELLGGEAELRIVEGATHLFEEPGALEEVAALARDWLVRHIGGTRPPAADKAHGTPRS